MSRENKAYLGFDSSKQLSEAIPCIAIFGGSVIQNLTATQEIIQKSVCDFYCHYDVNMVNTVTRVVLEKCLLIAKHHATIFFIHLNI